MPTTSSIAPNFNRFAIYTVISAALSLVFIPLMSYYGLRICPILSTHSFYFGCSYSAVYVGSLTIFNFLIVRMALKNQFKYSYFALSYVLATVLALVFLYFLFKLDNSTSQSRGPEVLLVTSLLLAVTQHYGLQWVTQQKNQQSTIALSGFSQLWLQHVARLMLPIVLAVSILLHFLYRQSFVLNNGHIAAGTNEETIVTGSGLLVLFLVLWMSVTYLFYFLAEFELSRWIQIHFLKLVEMDLNYKTPATSSWGLWRAMIDQLNASTVVLREKTSLLKSFSRFVTNSVAEQAMSNELKEGQGVQKELTVLMTDIRSFTSMSEKLTPAEVVTLLNEYFSVMIGIASKYNITIDKFIGDGILAYVEPEENETLESQKAVLAGMEMIEKLKELNLGFTKKGFPEIRIGVGIYRGPVILGLIGSHQKLQHTIIGDSVNRAARLESLCKDLGSNIIISENIYQALDLITKNKFKSHGPKSVKGLLEQINIFGSID